MGDKSLAFVLRLAGILALFALVAAAMPFSWMVGMHRWLGLGEMPAAPVVEYLARSVSLFYALFGAVFVYLAGDVGRYRPLLAFMGGLIAFMGIGFIAIDLGAGMPWWWSAIEGPPTVAGGIFILWLTRREREPRTR